MKKLNRGRLSLDRETLAPLTSKDLDGVAGGAQQIASLACPISSACTPIIRPIVNTVTRIFTR